MEDGAAVMFSVADGPPTDCNGSVGVGAEVTATPLCVWTGPTRENVVPFWGTCEAEDNDVRTDVIFRAGEDA